MTRSRDPQSHHPYAVLATLVVGSSDQTPAPVAAEPDVEPERRRVHRRLLATLTRRLENPGARPARSERA
jgi:hypothetical protein